MTIPAFVVSTQSILSGIFWRHRAGCDISQKPDTIPIQTLTQPQVSLLEPFAHTVTLNPEKKFNPNRHSAYANSTIAEENFLRKLGPLIPELQP